MSFDEFANKGRWLKVKTGPPEFWLDNVTLSPSESTFQGKTKRQLVACGVVGKEKCRIALNGESVDFLKETTGFADYNSARGLCLHFIKKSIVGMLAYVIDKTAYPASMERADELATESQPEEPKKPKK